MRLLFSTLLCFYSFYAFTQPIPASSVQAIQKIEPILQKDAHEIVFANDWIERFQADSAFIRNFVKALKTPYSFYYPFDSVQNISKLYAPDSSFRIFSWQVMKDFTYYRQRGAIQMRTSDGSLKLYPLFDASEFTKAPTDSIRTPNNWIGAIYYKIILKTYKNKKYYTLLGLDENNARSEKKWIEVLTFNAEGYPEFGGNYFKYPADGIKPPQPAYRFCIEYKKDAGVRMNYDPKYQAIIFSRVVSESPSEKNPYNLIPYGDYEGFRWVNGYWVYVNNPFQNIIFDKNQTDLPAPILDDKGNRKEKVLEEISKKNMEKAQQKKDSTNNQK
jgi:hypothetical protein